MSKYLLLILTLFPALTKGQTRISEQYVDDHINELTYLKFNPDNTFEYRYLNDLMGDFATGHYKRSRDTLFLFYNPDSVQLKAKAEGMLTSHDERNRADSLVVKSNKLYLIVNGVSLYDAPPEILDHVYGKPSKNSPYRRKYFFFGKYRTVRSKRYYMIDIADAVWNRRKRML